MFVGYLVMRAHELMSQILFLFAICVVLTSVHQFVKFKYREGFADPEWLKIHKHLVMVRISTAWMSGYCIGVLVFMVPFILYFQTVSRKAVLWVLADMICLQLSGMALSLWRKKKGPNSFALALTKAMEKSTPPTPKQAEKRLQRKKLREKASTRIMSAVFAIVLNTWIVVHFGVEGQSVTKTLLASIVVSPTILLVGMVVIVPVSLVMALVMMPFRRFMPPIPKS